MEVASVCLETLAHIYSTIMAVLKIISCSCVTDVSCSSLRYKGKMLKLHAQLYVSVTEILTAVKRKQLTRELDCCCFILL